MFRTYLQENGWSEGRIVDITPYLDSFQKDNIQPSPYALDILREFGNIEIRIKESGLSGLDEFTELVIDPRRGAVMSDEIQEFEEVIGEQLTPVGFFPRSDLDIFVSQSGEFYFAGTTEFMYITRLGRDFISAVECYFSGEYLKKSKFPNLHSDQLSISKETLKILRDSGWYEGRNIDIKEIKEDLEQLGYVVFPKVEDFLREFGDLVVEDTVNEEIHNTSIRFTNYYRHGGFKYEEKYAGEKLVPVGMIDSENLMLLVSESGKVYCSTGKLGDTAIEAWDHLISGYGMKLWGIF
ncbi:SUKH-3 domain-containing protein [Paenibacillus macerans]|uniref:SUKH-3 domain-containing protein n=1 Tax=Paenibacillus macerans TaxID=44252 RepID=UPI00203E50BC|nr:SUKH-3 domain-containing protein [Paenibacillus macerans]MCM3700719.1 SUKH-3 domain-containing protein [Paenibacillus macerans]